MSETKYIALIVVQTMLVSFGLPAQQPGSAAPFVPGEAIVEFATRSETGKLVARASKEEDPALTSQLDAAVKALGHEIGMPTELRRIGSGGNVVVAICQKELLLDLQKQILANPSVKAVDVSVQNQGLMVSFVPGSSEAQTVDTLARNNSRDHDPQMLTKNLKLHVPLKARVVSHDTVFLTFDSDGLTLDLVSRLQQRHDVRVAQPNFLYGPSMSPDLQ